MAPPSGAQRNSIRPSGTESGTVQIGRPVLTSQTATLALVAEASRAELRLNQSPRAVPSSGNVRSMPELRSRSVAVPAEGVQATFSMTCSAVAPSKGRRRVRTS